MSSAAIRAASSGDRSRWASGKTPSRKLAPHHGDVTPGRVRHDRTEGRGPVSVFFQMVADPAVDGPPLVAGAMEELEHRYLREAEAGPKVLRPRLGHLLFVGIHDGHARLVRALLASGGGDVTEELREQASRCVEAAAIRCALGLGR